MQNSRRGGENCSIGSSWSASGLRSVEDRGLSGIFLRRSGWLSPSDCIRWIADSLLAMFICQKRRWRSSRETVAVADVLFMMSALDSLLEAETCRHRLVLPVYVAMMEVVSRKLTVSQIAA